MHLRTVLVFAIAAVVLPARMHAGQMVVFGDSLSDGGYFFGLRFTDPDGDLWHEYLADRLDHERATTSSFGGSGLNLAVGGSLVSDLQSQVDRYESRYTWQSGDLCTLWIGGNDLRSDPSQDMTALAAQIGGIITQLDGLGIDHIIVPNLPDLGAIPESQDDASEAAARTAGTIAFNDALSAELASLSSTLSTRIELLDVFSMFEHMLSFQSDFGFTNVTGTLSDNPDGNPDEYAFWDDIHPTTRSHFLVAGIAQALVDPTAPIETVSQSLDTSGSLRQSWLANPAKTYDIFSGSRLDDLSPVASFTGSTAYTAEISAPSQRSGFFQTRQGFRTIRK